MLLKRLCTKTPKIGHCHAINNKRTHFLYTHHVKIPSYFLNDFKQTRQTLVGHMKISADNIIIITR